jgi:gliding motility-associated-like protein
VASQAQMKFIENRRQWDPRILFNAEIPGGNLFIEKNSFTYNFMDREAFKKIHDHKMGQYDVKGHTVRVKFLNANPDSYTGKMEQAPEDYNFFLGNDPARWVSGIKACGKILIYDLYKGIDLELYSLENQYLKYNFIVHPGADPSQIKMEYSGADKLFLHKGRLNIVTSLNTVIEDAPLTFTMSSSKTSQNVNCRFVLNENVLSFAFPSGFPQGEKVIIDPKVIFSTYSASLSDNWGFTGTFDNQGHAYSGGTVYGPSFPVTTGAYQTVYRGGVTVPGSGEDLARDCGILKYSPDGTQLLYCTYLGGSHNEQPHSMVVNNAGELCIFGTTFSGNFPVTAGTVDPTFNGKADIFVLKLSADGKNLLASTFVGGSERDGLNGSTAEKFPSTSPICYNYGDEFRGEIVNDANDNIYVASCTEGGFPVKNGFRNSFGGVQDGCVFKMDNSLSAILWASYVGGSAFDAAYGIAVDEMNNIFVCGGTNSADLKFNVNGLNPSYLGNRDGFLIKVHISGSALEHGTFVGTSFYDQAYFVQLDKYGNPYVTGQTAGGSVYPVSQNIYTNPNSGQYITKFTNDLSQITRSMVFGSGRSQPDISPCAFLVDKCERIFISGWGGRTNRPDQGNGGFTTGLPTTTDGFQRSTDGSDFYVAIFSKNLNNLLYGTFFGGNAIEEHVDGGTSRFDKEGIIYQSVCGGCGGDSTNFPTYPNPGVYGPKNKSNNCNNAFFKIDFENLNREPVPPLVGNVLTITATDEIAFPYTVTDPEGDSVFVHASGKIFGGADFPTPFATMPDAQGLGSASTEFRWKPGCQHISQDTIYVTVEAWDNGCPAPKSIRNVFKLIVKAPPLPKPPKVICLKNIDNNSLSITWDTAETDKYFRYYLLYKALPGGPEIIVDTIFKSEQATYTDNDASNHTTVNYCYYLVGVNVCGFRGDSSYKVCSVDEFLKPISPTYLHHATVIDNKYTGVKWFTSSENDFDSYQVYKRNDKIHTGVYNHYRTIKGKNDTLFIDTAVNVHALSYCYYVVVTDGCNHISPPSNRGCTILLQGSMKPFEHTLNWSPYSVWQGGVKSYELLREPADLGFNVIGLTDSTGRNFVDGNLDYDYGLYHYRVVAKEGDGGYEASSTSNDVELIQPPLLHVPNAFTPNKDLLNDIWGIVPVFVKDFTLKVYNRWGQQVFESNDKKLQWDGRYNDNDPFDNVFIYLITYTGWDGSTFYKYGNVTVLR